MNFTQVAIYARVSSEPHAETHTIASQVAALRERVAADGLAVSEAMQFLDEGYSGGMFGIRVKRSHSRLTKLSQRAVGAVMAQAAP